MKLKTALLLASLAAAVAMASSVQSQSAPAFDHYKCYKIKDSAKFLAGINLTPLQNPPFEIEQCKVIGKAKLFCIPVDKEVTSFINKTKPPLNPASFPAQDLEFDRLCYKVRCPKLTQPLSLQVTDQFGTRTLSKFKPQLLCTPAVKGTIPTTTTTVIVTTTTLPHVPCVDQAGPQCSGPCPDPVDTCVPKVDGTGGCECRRPCNLSVAPTCDGDCPPGAVCQDVGGSCDCFDVIPCTQLPPTQCADGGCPPGLICQSDAANQVCICL